MYTLYILCPFTVVSMAIYDCLSLLCVSLCLKLQMSVPAATAQRADSNSEMQSAAVTPSFIPSQSGKIPGRKRGRPPLRNVAKMDFPGRYPESLPPLKVPKKRGRKPGFKVSRLGGLGMSYGLCRYSLFENTLCTHSLHALPILWDPRVSEQGFGIS